MEEVDLQDDSERKEEAEQQDDESTCSDKVDKVELRDDDSFEVISLSCNASSKYSTSGDSDEDDALVISINDSMNKSFPEVQLLSDLVKSTPSSITLTAENVSPEDKCILPKDGLSTEVRHESCSDIAISTSCSEGDQASSIVLVEELSEAQEAVLNIEHTSPSVPSQGAQEHDHAPQFQWEVNENVQSSHTVVSDPVNVFEKPAISTKASQTDVNLVEECPNANVMIELPEESSFHSNPQKVHSVFVGEQFQSAQISESVPNIQAKELVVVNSADRKDSPAKTVLSVSHLPKVQNSAAGLWEWLCPKNLLHKLFDKAWASIDAMISTLDPQMRNNDLSTGVKPDFEVLIATTCDFESWPIRKALRKTFFDKVSIANLSVTLGCVPAQPVGFQSGLYCAERRIKFMRENRLVDKNKIIVATSPVLVEVTPLRWHHTTCLMLDDPHLGLTLHTFTQTVPVPNIYASQAQLRTPCDYHLKHLGFNITVGRVISIMTGIPENDWQHSMTGISFCKILESAAVVLAGMYKSYLSGISY